MPGSMINPGMSNWQVGMSANNRTSRQIDHGTRMDSEIHTVELATAKIDAAAHLEVLPERKITTKIALRAEGKMSMAIDKATGISNEEYAEYLQEQEAFNPLAPIQAHKPETQEATAQLTTIVESLVDRVERLALIVDCES